MGRQRRRGERRQAGQAAGSNSHQDREGGGGGFQVTKDENGRVRGQESLGGRIEEDGVALAKEIKDDGVKEIAGEEDFEGQVKVKGGEEVIGEEDFAGEESFEG